MPRCGLESSHAAMWGQKKRALLPRCAFRICTFGVQQEQQTRLRSAKKPMYDDEDDGYFEPDETERYSDAIDAHVQGQNLVAGDGWHRLAQLTAAWAHQAELAAKGLREVDESIRQLCDEGKK